MVYDDGTVRVAMDKTVVFQHEGSIRLVLSRAQMREIVRGYEREVQQEAEAHYAEEAGE